MVALNVMKRLAGGVFLVLAALLLAGCQDSGGTMRFPPAQGGPPPVTSGDIFNVGDLVVVTFSGLETVLQPHEERVKEDGTITLPFIGAVMALGKGPGELQKEIRTKYIEGRIYPSNLNVTVKGQERLFFVDGEVRGPGRYVWIEGMTVLKAVSSAGGFTDFARRSRVTVTRMDGTTFTVNCDRAADKPELDLPVYPGDRVVVSRRVI